MAEVSVLGVNFASGLGWYFNAMYNDTTHLNRTTQISVTISPQPYNEQFLYEAALSTNTITKTAISHTERHGSNYKFQPQVAWSEDGGSKNLIRAAMTYWDGFASGFTNTLNIDLTNFGGGYVIDQDTNLNPAIISSMSDDKTIVAWDYTEQVATCVDNAVEPLAFEVDYSNDATNPIFAPSTGYLGVGEVALGSGTLYPLDTLTSISLAGKQSTDILYFFYDFSDGNVYSKHAAPNASTLKQQAADKNEEAIISPNPVNTQLQLHLPDAESTYYLSLFDISGKLILQTSGNAIALQVQLRKSILQMEAGSYVLKVENSSFNQNQLIIK